MSVVASDTASDSFTYAQDWEVNVGVGAAFSQTTGSGKVDLTISVGNATAGLSMFCYDLSGVAPQPQTSTGMGNGSTASVSPSLALSGESQVIALWAWYGTAPQLTAGPGYSLTSGSPITGHSSNYVASEYAKVAPGTTTCAMTSATSQAWGGMCFAFPSSF